MTTTPEIHGGGVLGERVEGTRRQLDIFDLPKFTHEVTYTSDEVTSLCPITSAPDWYEVSITVYGSMFGIESKSLKLYLQSFRNDGQFCEQFASTIASDVHDVTGGQVTVEVIQKPRGGVSITAVGSKG